MTKIDSRAELTSASRLMAHVLVYGDRGTNESRPKFDDIASFKEFSTYYWCREELSQICKGPGIEHKGTKQELNETIKAYFSGARIRKPPVRKVESIISLG